MNCHLKTRRKRSDENTKETGRDESRPREVSSASNVMLDDVVQLNASDYEALRSYLG